jgi:hypothetical protein
MGYIDGWFASKEQTEYIGEMARYLYRLFIFESVSNWYCSHDVHVGGRAETRKQDRIKSKSMWHGRICNVEFKWIEHGRRLYFQHGEG